MRLVPDGARQEIERQRPLHARVRAEGFELDGNPAPRLQGRILEARLTRKLFVDKQLICQSLDGRRGTGGIDCASCERRTIECQAILRIHVALTDGRHCTLDLASSSARNLMELDDELSATDIPLAARHVILTVVSHERWGEVCFAIADDHA